ncbi:MAG: hypothetical protein AAF850_11085 [Pseudomonadota bacterium]
MVTFTSTRTLDRTKDRLEYRIYLALVIPGCFAATAVKRLFGRKSRASVLTQEKPSFWREMMDLADSAVPWIFSAR